MNRLTFNKYLQSTHVKNGQREILFLQNVVLYFQLQRKMFNSFIQTKQNTFKNTKKTRKIKIYFFLQKMYIKCIERLLFCPQKILLVCHLRKSMQISIGFYLSRFNDFFFRNGSGDSNTVFD